jgi:hypothetical protein
MAPAAYEAEGIGGQFIKWNSARLLARRHGLTFLLLPFTRSSHSGDFDWETFLGFGAGEVTPGAVDLHDARVLRMPPMHITPRGIRVEGRSLPLRFASDLLAGYSAGAKTLVHLVGPTWFDEGHEESAQELRLRYQAARVRDPVAVPERRAKWRAGLHVRRGDVRALRSAGDPQGVLRWLDEDYYVAIARNLAASLGEGSVELFVYSDDPASAFVHLPKLQGVTFRRDGDQVLPAHAAFHEMTQCDILVPGLSSFSYLAGLINANLVLAPAFGMQAVPANWLKCERDGSFDRGAMLRRLGSA